MDLTEIPREVWYTAIEIFQNLTSKGSKRNRKRKVKSFYSVSVKESYSSGEYKRSISIKGRSEFEDSDQENESSN